MVLVLLLMPVLAMLICGLVLFSAGRTPRERLTIFFDTPKDSGRDEGLITIIRFIFWVSLIVSVWMVVKTCRGRGAF